jgi:hypothetical protein
MGALSDSRRSHKSEYARDDAGNATFSRKREQDSIYGKSVLDAREERLHTMRTLLIAAALLLPIVCAHGQTVEQKAATKTLARKAQAQCDAETPRVARTLTAVVKETRVYAVFYSPKFSKCLAAVYLPIDKNLVAASLLNLDTAGGAQHIVWENLFPKAFDAISALDFQIDKLSK